MFLGQHSLPLDDQNRLQLPPGFQRLLADGAFILQGFDRNIIVLTGAAFQEIYQHISTLNMADPMARLLSRMTLGTASEIVLDGDGRFPVSQELREYAGLEDEVVLVGQGLYFELWSPALWTTQKLRLQDAEANAVRFAALNLTVAR